MATVNEGQSNVLLKDVLITDTLPGSATNNSILNPLSSSSKQNIGDSSLMLDSNQIAIEPDQPSVTTNLLKSKDAASESISNKSDDSLIVPKPLNSSLNGSVIGNTSRDTLSASQSATDAKDTLTGSSKDAPSIAIKADSLTAADSLTNNQSAKEISLDKKNDSLVAEKENKSETLATNSNLISQAKESTSEAATTTDKLSAKKPVATVDEVAKDANKQNSTATTQAVETLKSPATSEAATTTDKLSAEKPVATIPEVAKNIEKENSTATGGDHDKKVADNSQNVAVETPKELSRNTPKSEPVADNLFTSGKFIVDSTGQVGIDFLFDGGLYKGQLAIVSLKGMEKFVPGAAEFINEVASSALSNSVKGHVVINDLSEGARFTGNLPEGNSNEGTYLGVKTFAMTSGDEFGVMLVPNGTVQEVLNNPVAGGDKRPLFSMATANPAEGFYVGQIADVTGSGKTFAMEDMRVDLGSDRDYNDLIFQVRGATGTAVNLDSVINPEKDWRKADIGKALIAYSKGEPVAEKPATPVVKNDTTQVVEKGDRPSEPVAEKPATPVVKNDTTQDIDIPKTELDNKIVNEAPSENLPPVIKSVADFALTPELPVRAIDLKCFLIRKIKA